jgi:hypothetical protein
MTEREFVTAVEATGATDVWIMSTPFDCDNAVGVAVSARRARDRRLCRSAVRMPAGTPIDTAFPALLDWAQETLPN